MRIALTAFALGVAAFGAFALLAAIAAAAVAEAAGRSSYELALFGIELMTFERRADATTTAFGPGLAVIPLLGGAINAVAAVALARLRRGSA